ncbi:MAG: DUF3016 domain-containing protein [Verrucomicrobiota bacterium]
MKTSYFKTLLALTGIAMAAGPAMALNEKSNSKMDVVFLEPTKFTDVRDSDMGDYERTTYLDSLKEHLFSQAKNYVPEGYKLSVTFTDIDMAGDFEPWRGPRFGDIRIVKDIYPPRIELSFRFTDADGKVVKEGKRELRDLAFLSKINMSFRDDPVRHEKGLLDDWLRNEFPKVPKAKKST